MVLTMPESGESFIVVVGKIININMSIVQFFHENLIMNYKIIQNFQRLPLNEKVFCIRHRHSSRILSFLMVC